jgi:hypothetical protein
MGLHPIILRRRDSSTKFIRRQVDRSESGESEDVHSKQMEKALVFDEDAEIDEKPINIEFMSKLTRI